MGRWPFRLVVLSFQGMANALVGAFFKTLFAAKRQKHKQCTASNPCLRRSVNRMKKQRAGKEDCAGPAQYYTVFGVMGIKE